MPLCLYLYSYPDPHFVKIHFPPYFLSVQFQLLPLFLLLYHHFHDSLSSHHFAFPFTHSSPSPFPLFRRRKASILVPAAHLAVVGNGGGALE